MDANPPSRPQASVGAERRALPRSRSVLLLVDFINPLDFEGAEDIAAAALAAAKVASALKHALSQRGVPAIYANDNYGVWRSEFRDLLARCAGCRAESAEIARLLAPGPADLTVLKPRHSAFFATPLDLLLAQMHVQEIVLVGLAADICVMLSAADAYLRGYRVWAPADCTAAESPAQLREALDWMQRVLRCDVRASAERAELPSG